MTSSGPTKACPRCNSVLPAQATFCGACGWQFSAPAGPPAASAPAGGPTAPGAWPQSQPTAQAPVQPQPPAMPGYPLPGQLGAAGYAPVAAAPRPWQGVSKKLLAVIVIAAVLTIGVPGYFIFGGHVGSSLFVDRHGMPGNIPLPSGATFKVSTGVSGTKEWYWTVESPNTPTALRDFYQSNLSSNGWTKIQTDGDASDYDVSGCQSNQLVFVSMATFAIDVHGAQGSDPRTISGPSGGSAMRILVSSDPTDLSNYCS